MRWTRWLGSGFSRKEMGRTLYEPIISQFDGLKNWLSISVDKDKIWMTVSGMGEPPGRQIRTVSHDRKTYQTAIYIANRLQSEQVPFLVWRGFRVSAKRTSRFYIPHICRAIRGLGSRKAQVLIDVDAFCEYNDFDFADRRQVEKEMFIPMSRFPNVLVQNIRTDSLHVPELYYTLNLKPDENDGPRPT